MAALCSSLEAEDLLARGHADQNLRPIYSRGSRKRGRSVELTTPERRRIGKGEGCDIDSLQRSLSARLGWESMSRTVSFHSMERAFSYEVSALRAAAAAAVAEFTGSLEPSLQLTAPDKAHELERQEAEPDKPPSQGGRASSFRLNNRVSAASIALDGHAGSALSTGHDSSEFRRINQQPGFSKVFTQRGCPPHGAKAICGRRPRMEDAYTAVPFLLEVPVPAGGVVQPEVLPPRIAPQVRSASNSPNSSDGEIRKADIDAAVAAEAERLQSHASTSTSNNCPEEESSYLETLHFFGVFDGHGGAEAALHCAQTLHQHIAEALAATTDPSSDGFPAADLGEGPSEATSVQPAEVVSMPSGLPAILRQVDGEPGESVSDSLADQALEEQAQDSRADGLTCNSVSFESALTSAFNRTDEEFGKADNAALVGTTAVVTLVGSRQLYVANCGDSRAVLSRGGTAIPLTDDHKAAREDETARVEAAGGQILFWNGVRVMGVLAVSRAIGDHCLRPYVIAQPEVTILARRADDELLLLASDGLWDVLSNQEACTLAKRCLRRARQRGASRQSAARIAATVLTRAAVDRGSRDNVTVLVVDLSTGATEADVTTRTQSAFLAEDATDQAHDRDTEERSLQSKGSSSQ